MGPKAGDHWVRTLQQKADHVAQQKMCRRRAKSPLNKKDKAARRIAGTDRRRGMPFESESTVTAAKNPPTLASEYDCHAQKCKK